jgi:hypothetical protein
MGLLLRGAGSGANNTRFGQQPQQFPDRLAVGMMVDFQIVTQRIDVTHSAANIRLRPGLDPPQSISGNRVVSLRVDKAGDELRLVIHQPQHAAVGLQQADYKQVVVLRVQTMHEQPRPIPLPVEMRLVDKREADPVAGGIDDQVVLASQKVR